MEPDHEKEMRALAGTNKPAQIEQRPWLLAVNVFVARETTKTIFIRRLQTNNVG